MPELEIVYRPDFTNSLIHLTKGKKIVESGRWVQYPAFESLKKILEEGIIRGGFGFIKGPNKAVCLSEIPLSSLKLFAKPEPEESRYRFYGVCLKKKHAFECGARPAIYIPDEEGEWIPNEEKWRQVRFEHGIVDFTFEREWRKKGDLDLRGLQEFYVIIWSWKESEELKKAAHTEIKSKICGFLPMEHLIQMF
jgi:hypothetical protein